MQKISLGSTGRMTTRLGFGCSSIMGVLNRRQSLALLESAFDAGIRHFDTAPMYGYGEAESCLGEFLSRHRGEATVTTKFGIPAPAGKGMMQIARGAVGPLVQRFPGLKRRLQRSVARADNDGPKPAPVANPIFNPEQARASLERSLAALRVERLDLWLLHDVKAIDLAVDSKNDSLLRLLEDSVREGKVGMFGVGSDRDIVPVLESMHPEYCGAVQYEWSVLNPQVPDMARFRIHHRALSQHFHALAEAIEAHPKRCREWSEEVGEDLASPDMLGQLMLKASYVLNAGAILLFSSKQPEHIQANVAVAGDTTLEEPARRFYTLVQREGLASQMI